VNNKKSRISHVLFSNIFFLLFDHIMSEKKEKTKINTEENEKLKTQIDASIGIARSLINSWLPPPKPGEKLEDDDEDDTLTKYSTGRPDR